MQDDSSVPCEAKSEFGDADMQSVAGSTGAIASRKQAKTPAYLVEELSFVKALRHQIDLRDIKQAGLSTKRGGEPGRDAQGADNLSKHLLKVAMLAKLAPASIHKSSWPEIAAAFEEAAPLDGSPSRDNVLSCLRSLPPRSLFSASLVSASTISRAWWLWPAPSAGLVAAMTSM